MQNSDFSDSCNELSKAEAGRERGKGCNKKQKRPPTRPESAFGRSESQRLEDNLDGQLHVEGFAGTKARCARVVADGVTHHAESIGGSRGAPVSRKVLV